MNTARTGLKIAPLLLVVTPSVLAQPAIEHVSGYRACGVTAYSAYLAAAKDLGQHGSSIVSERNQSPAPLSFSMSPRIETFFIDRNDANTHTSGQHTEYNHLSYVRDLRRSWNVARDALEIWYLGKAILVTHYASDGARTQYAAAGQHPLAGSGWEGDANIVSFKILASPSGSSSVNCATYVFYIQSNKLPTIVQARALAERIRSGIARQRGAPVVYFRNNWTFPPFGSIPLFYHSMVPRVPPTREAYYAALSVECRAEPAREFRCEGMRLTF